jgi:hypothetical protein
MIDTGNKTQEGGFTSAVVANQGDTLSVPDRAVYSPKRLNHRTSARAPKGTTSNRAHQGRFEAPRFGGSYRNPQPHILQQQDNSWIQPINLELPLLPLEHRHRHQTETVSADVDG